MASNVKTWRADHKIPKNYEQEVIGLACEQTGALEQAFRMLDAERSHDPRPNDGIWSTFWKGLEGRTVNPEHRPFADEVWLTGTLITILAFDCPPITSRSLETWDSLKSRLEAPDSLSSMKKSAGINEMLAKWPWTDEHGSWQVMPVYGNFWGSSDGRIAPRFVDKSVKNVFVPTPAPLLIETDHQDGVRDKLIEWFVRRSREILLKVRPSKVR